MRFKLHFFKHPLSPTPTPVKNRRKWSFSSFLIGTVFVLACSYLLHPPRNKVYYDHSLSVGDIARADIVVSNPMKVVDTEATNENRKKAIENVIPIYEYSLDNQAKTLNTIKEWFAFIRSAKTEYSKDPSQVVLTRLKNETETRTGLELSESDLRLILQTGIFDRIDLNQLILFIQTLYEKKLLNSVPKAIKNKDGLIEIIYKDGQLPDVVKAEEFYDIDSAQSALEGFLDQQRLSPKSGQFAASILKEFLNPNIVYSIPMTREAEQRIAAQVKPVVIELKPGRVILRKGDEVEPRHLDLLRKITEGKNPDEHQLSTFYLILLIIGFLTLFGASYFNVWVTGGINKEKLFAVTGATLLVSIVLYRASLFLLPLILKNLSLEIPYDVSSIFYAIPCGFGVLVIAFIFNLQSAVLFSFINSIVGGILCNWDLNVFVYILLGNLAAGYGIEFYQRLKRIPIIKASMLWMLPVNMVTISLFHLTKTDLNMLHLSVNVFMGVFSAIVSTILANFMIPIWEQLFKLVTELKLIELTNLNQPVFREMLEKAPGTYHHSLMVASLSEAVAQDMGLSPLLQRAMALYHDIGKINSPHFFTENNTIYKNPHDHMAPRESAKSIIAHIEDGIERAEKLKIPPMVRSAIEQHHGSKRVRYFYEKAREMSAVDSDEFDDKAFRYPGNKPKNIENAIIMLADQVEAASKSLASPSDEEIKNVIEKIINTNIEEGQFDECEGLTFKAINIIAGSFWRKLSSIYHMRVSYPGFNFKEKEPAEDIGQTRPEIVKE
ncbi:MAG: HD family phosphohydrolase [Candidatus Omnitrophota bacterium]